MRPIWKGHISFGLVNIPVALYPAEQRTDLQLHMIDSRNFSRVRYERVNADTGEEVPWNEIVKGYEYDDGNYVVIGDKELKAAAPESTQTVEIESFVDIEQIDPVYFDRPYYLEPGKKGEKGYVLLREAMRESRRAGIATVVIRTRQYIAAMVPRGDALVLHLLRYHGELRSIDQLDLPGSASDVGVTKQELSVARTLIESMQADWDPTEHRDEYREALMAYIEKRIKAGDIEQAPEAKEPKEERSTTPADLMETLKRSVRHGGEPRADRNAARKKTTKRTKRPASKKKKAAKRG